MAEKKDPLGAGWGRPDLMWSSTFSSQRSKQFRRGPAEAMEGSAALCAPAASGHRPSTTWRHSPDPPPSPPTEISHGNNSAHWGREEGGAAKLEEYFATQLHQPLDAYLFIYYLFCAWANTCSCSNHTLQGFPSNAEASHLFWIHAKPQVAAHVLWARATFAFTGPFLHKKIKTKLIFHDCIGIQTNIIQAGFH